MKIYLVGGAVRDQLLGLPVKERDYVVVGASVQEMLQLGYRLVGKEFPVFLHPETNEEYALARTERKVKPGYKGFTVDTSPHVTLIDDLRRRDLTINAMAIDLDTNTLVDPYNGQTDIAAKKLRHVSEAFGEDPVRILRLGRFLARYAHLGFTVDESTQELMQQMVKAGEVNALVAERVFKELERSLKEPDPQQFFKVLDNCHALPILFPHLLINGDGIRALTATVLLNQHANIRFAVLMHAYPEDQPKDNPEHTKKMIAELCHRYRMPNAYRELAQLTALNYKTALSAHTLSPEALLTFLSSIDVFRRRTRFKHFMTVCELIAHANAQAFDKTWLTNGVNELNSINVQALIAKGYTGPRLAIRLKEERLATIREWKARSQ